MSPEHVDHSAQAERVLEDGAIIEAALAAGWQRSQFWKTESDLHPLAWVVGRPVGDGERGRAGELYRAYVNRHSRVVAIFGPHSGVSRGSLSRRDATDPDAWRDLLVRLQSEDAPPAVGEVTHAA